MRTKTALPTRPLVIFGAEDRPVPVETAKLFLNVPGAKVELVDGAGHSPMVEQPGKTVAHIKEFWRPRLSSYFEPSGTFGTKLAPTLRWREARGLRCPRLTRGLGAPVFALP